MPLEACVNIKNLVLLRELTTYQPKPDSFIQTNSQDHVLYHAFEDKAWETENIHDKNGG